MVIITRYAQQRFDECMAMQRRTSDNSLMQCLSRLEKWRGDIEIYNDHDKQSFFFVQRHKDGSEGVCGGIIYHGKHDGFGAGINPTFSVSLTRASGYQIHT